jgi:hypothetical protein
MEASVKVMRSFDYCHFEIGLTEKCGDIDSVNSLRKKAAILVDDAVRQYQIAKIKESKRASNEPQVRLFIENAEHIKKNIPKGELTPEQAAILRAYEDQSFWKQYNEDEYYYEDTERDYHFSMLNRLKGIKVKCEPPQNTDKIRALMEVACDRNIMCYDKEARSMVLSNFLLKTLQKSIPFKITRIYVPLGFTLESGYCHGYEFVTCDNLLQLYTDAGGEMVDKKRDVVMAVGENDGEVILGAI